MSCLNQNFKHISLRRTNTGALRAFNCENGTKTDIEELDNWNSYYYVFQFKNKYDLCGISIDFRNRFFKKYKKYKKIISLLQKNIKKYDNINISLSYYHGDVGLSVYCYRTKLDTSNYTPEFVSYDHISYSDHENKSKEKRNTLRQAVIDFTKNSRKL